MFDTFLSSLSTRHDCESRLSQRAVMLSTQGTQRQKVQLNPALTRILAMPVTKSVFESLSNAATDFESGRMPAQLLEPAAN